jgi:hypothetical protein
VERPTRDRGTHQVYVSGRSVKRSRPARRAGLSASAFLRALGLSEPIRSTADRDAVRELMRINGDLGRLGGLL